MYTIEVYNEFRNDGFGYEDDMCPMNYYIIRDQDSVLIAETDWTHGFLSLEQAYQIMRIYTNECFIAIIEGVEYKFSEK